MENPEKYEGNFWIIIFADKKVKLYMREAYFCIQNAYDWHGNINIC